jgi:ankyrin repeat protein
MQSPMGTYLALTQLIFANDAASLRERLASDGIAAEMMAAEGHQAFLGAAMRGQTEIVCVFADMGICRGADPDSGHTALSLAKYFGQHEAAAILEKAGYQEAEGGDPTESDFLNAVRRGQFEIAKSTLERTPGVVNARHEGFKGTGLHISIFFQHSSITALLCASGADLSARDCDGNTAIELARQWHVQDAIDILEKRHESRARN